jgi:hypothetical protein
VASSYRQPSNLLVRFNRDGLDQSPRLLAALRQRPSDSSAVLELPGDHLASAGLRRNLLGDWADGAASARSMPWLNRSAPGAMAESRRNPHSALDAPRADAHPAQDYMFTMDNLISAFKLPGNAASTTPAVPAAATTGGTPWPT